MLQPRGKVDFCTRSHGPPFIAFAHDPKSTLGAGPPAVLVCLNEARSAGISILRQQQRVAPPFGFAMTCANHPRQAWSVTRADNIGRRRS